MSEFWCEDIGNLIRVAKALADSGQIATASEAIEVFERPWRHEKVWQRLEGAAEPEAGERLLLTVEEAADYLGVSASSIRKWNSDGSGPTPVRMGATVRYTKDDLRAWVESRKQAV